MKDKSITITILDGVINFQYKELKVSEILEMIEGLNKLVQKLTDKNRKRFLKESNFIEE